MTRPNVRTKKPAGQRVHRPAHRASKPPGLQTIIAAGMLAKLTGH